MADQKRPRGFIPPLTTTGSIFPTSGLATLPYRPLPRVAPEASLGHVAEKRVELFPLLRRMLDPNQQ